MGQKALRIESASLCCLSSMPWPKGLLLTASADAAARETVATNCGWQRALHLGGETAFQRAGKWRLAT